VDPGVRAIARRLHDAVRELPIISPHGHVDPRLLLDDEPFPDPSTLFITQDHYVTRLLHAGGVPLEQLAVGSTRLPEWESRQVWRALCEHWPDFRGTPVRYWLESELADIFGVGERPGPDTADEIFDQVATRLQQPEYRPRALFERFGIEVLATTDDPADDLAVHRALQEDASFSGRVVPTFRPDRYLEIGAAGWREAVVDLGTSAGEDTGTYEGYIRALEARRRYFIEHGATSSDHSHIDLGSQPLEPAEAARIYTAALRDEVGPAEAVAFRRHMLSEMARMSCDDGLVMTVHPGIRRNHHTAAFERFGPDRGHDIPVQLEVTDALRPLLQRYGTHPGFHLVLFTVDETVFSREIAPLAGFYPSVYVGAPWWFLDAPDAVRRFRHAVTATAGFSRTSGFIDDTRAFCSIPVRHDMSRRLDSGYLAGLVAEHRLDMDEAERAMMELTSTNPRKVFKL